MAISALNKVMQLKCSKGISYGSYYFNNNHNNFDVLFLQ